MLQVPTWRIMELVSKVVLRTLIEAIVFDYDSYRSCDPLVTRSYDPLSRHRFLGYNKGACIIARVIPEGA